MSLFKSIVVYLAAVTPLAIITFAVHGALASPAPSLTYKYSMHTDHVYPGGHDGVPTCGGASRFLKDHWFVVLDGERHVATVNGTMWVWNTGTAVPGDVILTAGRGNTGMNLELIGDDNAAFGWLEERSITEDRRACADQVETSGHRI